MLVSWPDFNEKKNFFFRFVDNHKFKITLLHICMKNERRYFDIIQMLAKCQSAIYIFINLDSFTNKQTNKNVFLFAFQTGSKMPSHVDRNKQIL